MSRPIPIRKKYKTYWDTWEMLDGAILLYKRRDHERSNYNYRMKIQGVRNYVIETTGTRDLLQASRIAEERYLDLRHEYKNNGVIILSKKTWSKVWKEYVSEVIDRKLSRGEINAKRKSKMLGIWNNWIQPYWGQMAPNTINEKSVNDYWTWRMAQNDAPNNTLLDQSKVFTALVRYGAIKGYITLPAFKLTPPVKKERKRRGAFTLEQVQAINTYLTNWTREGNTTNNIIARRGFHTFVMMGFYSGMRLGEMLDLKWQSIQINKNGVMQIDVKDHESKTGFRTVVPMSDCIKLLDDWHNYTKFTKASDYIFPNNRGKRRTVESYEKMHRDTIKQMGDDYVIDRHGNPLLPYSYRHTYATLMLINNPEIRMEELATNMGTSIIQIEHHYSHVVPLDLQMKLSSQVIDLG